MYDVARPTGGNPLEETGRLPALFDSDRPAGATPAPPRHRQSPDYPGIQRSPEFTALRRRLRSFVFPMSLAFFAWYMTYVLLAAYAHDFMSTKVFGQVNVGMVLGIGQFASTALVTWLYLRYARRHLDPRIARIRAQAGLADGADR